MPIYFLQTGDGGPVKIGSTADVRARVQFLQCGSPERLRLLGVVDGDVFDERRVHRLLAAHRIRGEWFKPAPEVLAAAAAGREEAERIGIPDERESLPRTGSGDGIKRGVSLPAADSFAAILCARTKVLRERSGLVQREMAELLGVPLQNWMKYERRSPLPHHLIWTFCDLCGVKVDEFLRPGSEVPAEWSSDRDETRAA